MRAVLLALALLVVSAIAATPTNGGYPALETPVNGGFPSIEVPEAVNGGHPSLDLNDPAPAEDDPIPDPWPPGELPPLDYSDTPFDPRPDHVIGNGLLNATVGSSGFDTTRSKRYLHHSHASYCSAASIRSFSCAACKKASTSVSVYDVIDQSGFQAYVLYDKSKNEIIVAFRGSSNIQNWIANIQVWKAETAFLGLANAKVAKGFNDGHNALYPAVVSAVKKARAAHSGASLVLTGHSLGGALAAMMALHLKVKDGISANEVFTFGSPRIGNKAFAQAYASRLPKTYRMSNNHDIVPHLPPKAWGFLHYDQEIWEVGASYKECARGAEDPKCANSVILPNSVSDHLKYMQETRSC